MVLHSENGVYMTALHLLEIRSKDPVALTSAPALLSLLSLSATAKYLCHPTTLWFFPGLVWTPVSAYLNTNWTWPKFSWECTSDTLNCFWEQLFEMFRCLRWTERTELKTMDCMRQMFIPGLNGAKSAHWIKKCNLVGITNHSPSWKSEQQISMPALGAQCTAA